MTGILFIGDVVGKPGRRALKEVLPALKKEFSPTFTVVNGENSAGGLGIEPSTADEIYAAGADVISTGNHVWGKKTIYPYLDAKAAKILRPDNYNRAAPGRGWTVWRAENGPSFGVINLVGRVFMSDLVDCPFAAAERLLSGEAGRADFILVDFHAEATSEKTAMAHFLDGKVSVVVGTHTHVQTADERVLPGGTAYITDAGMCGPYDSVIGVDKESIVERFVTGLPTRFETAKGSAIVCGLYVGFDPASKQVVRLERISRLY